MKTMNFSGCRFLEKIPDFSMVPNLEELNFRGCTNLVEIHDSVGSRPKLVRLIGFDCYNLSSFPKIFTMTSLEYLCISGCSKLTYFPEFVCPMKVIYQIDFKGAGIEELPSSIQNLVGLRHFDLEGCINLKNLSSSIYQMQNLVNLSLKGCSKLIKLPEKMEDTRQSMPFNVSTKELLPLSPLKLDLSGSGIVTISASIKSFPLLEELDLRNCKQFREILELSPSIRDVDAEGCTSLILETIFEGPQRSQLCNTCYLPELSKVISFLDGIRYIYSLSLSVPESLSYSCNRNMLSLRSTVALKFLEIRFQTGSAIVKKIGTVIYV
jgi:Leucine-rich repeat (LRR) protein